MKKETPSIVRSSLSRQVYRSLRDKLMSGHFQPGERIKIHDLAEQLGVSETPVREAILLLANDGAIEMKAGYHFLTRHLTVAEYMEIRRLRLILEPVAAIEALANIDDAFIAELEQIHAKLIHAEETKDYPQALQSNFDFHFSIYRQSGMPQLTEILERLWIQAGPLLTFLYPYGHPTYETEHQHLAAIKALKDRDATALRAAIEQDLIQGGDKFIEYLKTMNAEAQPPIKKSGRKSTRGATPNT